MKSPTLNVSMVQSTLHWEDPEANLNMFDKKINAHKEKMEVVILPEMFNTGFSMNPVKLAESMDGPTVEWMRKTASAKEIVLGGSLIIAEGGKYYNRFVWMLPGGEFGYYDKRHLFAYGGESDEFTAGRKRLIASVKGWKINLMVCYDLRFPLWARQSVPMDPVKRSAISKIAEPEYDLLIYAANWPDTRIHAWKILLQARAIENQCYVIGVNRVGEDGNGKNHSGDSMAVDPLGTILYAAEEREEVHTITLRADVLDETRAKLPFLKDADSFIIGD